MQVNITITISHNCLINILEDHTFTLTAFFFHSQVVVTKNHILRWRYDRFTVFRVKDVFSRKKEQTCFSLSFFRQWNVDGHLVTVKVGIVGLTYQWVKTKGLTINQDRFEGLDTQTVEGRCAVKKYWVFLDNIFKNIPNTFITTFNHTFSGFHVTCVFTRNDFTHHKWFEKFDGHQTWHTTLVHFKCWTNGDNGTSREVNTFTKQVLTETTLFTFKHVAQRFKWTTTWSSNWTTTTSIIDKGIYRFLQHTFFVLHDDTRGIQFKQTSQTVVTVDNTTIKIVQVRCRKTSTIQLNHWTKVWWQYWQNVKNHPFWFVTRLIEGIKNVQTTNCFNTFLTSCCLQLFFEFSNFSFQIHLFQEILDSFCTHFSDK